MEERPIVWTLQSQNKKITYGNARIYHYLEFNTRKSHRDE